MLDDPASRLAEDSDTVRVVHDDDGVELARQFDDLRQACEVALHREDPVRDDQLASSARGAGETFSEPAQVRVRIDHLLRGTREPYGVDDARVVELVREDDGCRVGQRRNHRLVRVPARDVGQRRLGSREVCHLALELEMGLERSADEAHRGGARAVALEPLDPRPHDLGMVGEPEVVVRREHDHLSPPRHPYDRALRGLERVETLVGARVPERGELGPDLLGQRAHRPTSVGRRVCGGVWGTGRFPTPSKRRGIGCLGARPEFASANSGRGKTWGNMVSPVNAS